MFKKPQIYDLNEKSNQIMGRSSFIKKNDKIDYFLQLDLRMRGSMNEEKLSTYITELLNQVMSEYFIEGQYQKIKKIPKIKDDNLIYSLEFLENIINNNRFSSFTIKNYTYIHSFQAKNMLTLIDELNIILCNEFSKKYPKNKEILKDFCLPITYILKFFKKEIPSQEDYLISKNIDIIKEYYSKNFSNNNENLILQLPTITFYVSSECILKYFSNERFNDVMLNFINKIIYYLYI